MKPTFLVLIMLSVLTLSACSGQTAAPTIPDDAFVSTNCVAVSSSKPNNVPLTGVAVLQDIKNSSNFYLYKLSSGDVTQLSGPDETIGQVAVSPDHKALAFQAGNSKTNAWNLVLADSQGKRTATIPWKQGFFNLGNWINNSQILIASYPPLVVFNPYTGEQKGFTYADLPNYLDDNVSNRLADFDPTMTLALYKSKDDHDTLLGIADKKILAQVDNHPDPSPIAAWSPDGSQVAVVGTVIPGGTRTPLADIGHEIFTISRTGSMKQLTHLTMHYGGLLTISPAGMSWSPDGRYLAFWIIYRDSPGVTWQLAVGDVTTGKTTNYCISNVTTSIRPLTAPLWGASGHQLLVENRYQPNTNHLVILDLDQNAAFQVKDDAYPTGWMIP